jgi:hypothetical protein
MTAEGGWNAVGPFFVAFAITLGSMFIGLSHHAQVIYKQIRERRIKKYKARKAAKKNTTLQVIYGGMDVYWWIPIVLYFLCIGCAVMGIVFFQHNGYKWIGAFDPPHDQPMVFLGFWFVVLIMSWWLVNFMRPSLDRDDPNWVGAVASFIIHLGVFLAMVISDPVSPAGWLQIPLLAAILFIAVVSSLSYTRSYNRYVVPKYKQDGTICSMKALDFEPGCSAAA